MDLFYSGFVLNVFFALGIANIAALDNLLKVVSCSITLAGFIYLNKLVFFLRGSIKLYSSIYL